MSEATRAENVAPKPYDLEAHYQELEQKITAAGIPADCTAMQAIGYKEAVAAVQGKAAPQDAVAAIQLASRRYAKRQLTWLRRDPSIHWFYWKKTRILPDCLAFSTEILHTYGVS